MIGQVRYERGGHQVTITLADDGTITVDGLGEAGGRTIADHLAEEYAAAGYGPADGDPLVRFLFEIAREFGGTAHPADRPEGPPGQIY